jgi:hypothetical protein
VKPVMVLSVVVVIDESMTVEDDKGSVPALVTPVISVLVDDRDMVVIKLVSVEVDPAMGTEVVEPISVVDSVPVVPPVISVPVDL